MKNFAKGLLLSVVALGVGFAAIAVPFRLFDTLSAEGVRILFIVEIIVYLATGLIFLAVQDRKNKQKARQEQYHRQREIKIQEVMDNWYNLAA